MFLEDEDQSSDKDASSLRWGVLFVHIARGEFILKIIPHTNRAYLDALRVDKKRRDAHVRFVVLRDLGQADIVPLTPAEILPRSGRHG